MHLFTQFKLSNLHHYILLQFIFGFLTLYEPQFIMVIWFISQKMSVKADFIFYLF